MSELSVELDINYFVDGVDDDSQRFQAAAEWIAAKHQIDQLTVSISIVDDETIHEQNRQHMEHDWPTDVLSFLIEENGGSVDGEIIASSDMAARLCDAAGWTAADELLLYVVHGLLHIAGLDDLDPAARKQMREQEQECMLALGVAHAAGHLDRWEDVSY